MNIFGTTFDYQGRLAKIRKEMKQCDMDALLVHLWPNQYYISGMYQHLPWYPVETGHATEPPLIVFRDETKAPIFLCAWLTSNGLKEGTWIQDVRVLDKEPYGKLGWWDYTAQILKEEGSDTGTIGFEEDVVVQSTFKKLQSVLPKAQFKAADGIFQRLRMVKEPEEIAIIKESVLIAEEGLKAGMEAAKVGALESEVQKALEIELKRRGAIREVETMVQSGIRTANHRAFGANWKRIEENDLVAIDVGCLYKGYGSDLTRTWVVGTPSQSYQNIVDDLVRIREKIVPLLKPGVSLGEITDLGKGELKKAGYSVDRAAFPSNGVGLGNVTIHGIGLGPMHDPPHPSDRHVTLESGMTIAFTGGVRHATFTIRFEDDFVVVPGGTELINKDIPWKL
jgi:Xaa-Pro aminopeptidase